MSKQLRDMRERLHNEFEKQGWPYQESAPPAVFQDADSPGEQ